MNTRSMNGSANRSLTSASVQSLRTFTRAPQAPSNSLIRWNSQYSVLCNPSQPRMAGLVDEQLYFGAVDCGMLSFWMGSICSGASDQAAIAASQYAAS